MRLRPEWWRGWLPWLLPTVSGSLRVAACSPLTEAGSLPTASSLLLSAFVDRQASASAHARHAPSAPVNQTAFVRRPAYARRDDARPPSLRAAARNEIPGAARDHRRKRCIRRSQASRLPAPA